MSNDTTDSWMITISKNDGRGGGSGDVSWGISRVTTGIKGREGRGGRKGWKNEGERKRGEEREEQGEKVIGEGRKRIKRNYQRSATPNKSLQPILTLFWPLILNSFC